MHSLLMQVCIGGQSEFDLHPISKQAVCAFPVYPSLQMHMALCSCGLHSAFCPHTPNDTEHGSWQRLSIQALSLVQSESCRHSTLGCGTAKENLQFISAPNLKIFRNTEAFANLMHSTVFDLIYSPLDSRRHSTSGDPTYSGGHLQMALWLMTWQRAFTPQAYLQGSPHFWL